MTRKNLKVPEDLFLALRDDKDDQQSWPHYLEEQCLHDETLDTQADRLAEDIADRVAGHVRQDPEVMARAIVDEMEGRR